MQVDLPNQWASISRSAFAENGVEPFGDFCLVIGVDICCCVLEEIDETVYGIDLFAVQSAIKVSSLLGCAGFIMRERNISLDDSPIKSAEVDTSLYFG